jgi:hypothetical protein
MTQPGDGKDPYHDDDQWSHGPPQPPQRKSDNIRTWGTFCHLAGLSLLLGIPVGNVIGPLVIWVLKKDESPQVDEHGKDALNFQISWTIWMLVASLSILLLIGAVLLPVTLIAWLVLTIIGTIRASRGEKVSYPLTIQFLS